VSVSKWKEFRFFGWKCISEKWSRFQMCSSTTLPNQWEPRPRGSGSIFHVYGFDSVRVLHIFGIITSSSVQFFPSMDSSSVRSVLFPSLQTLLCSRSLWRVAFSVSHLELSGWARLSIVWCSCWCERNVMIIIMMMIMFIIIITTFLYTRV